MVEFERQSLSSFHGVVMHDAQRAMSKGSIEAVPPAELPRDLYNRAHARLDDGQGGVADLIKSAIEVALDDLGLGEKLSVRVGESRMFDDGQPGFFLDKNKPDFRFGESVSGEVWKNKRTASGERVK